MVASLDSTLSMRYPYLYVTYSWSVAFIFFAYWMYSSREARGGALKDSWNPWIAALGFLVDWRLVRNRCRFVELVRCSLTLFFFMAILLLKLVTVFSASFFKESFVMVCCFCSCSCFTACSGGEVDWLYCSGGLKCFLSVSWIVFLMRVVRELICSAEKSGIEIWLLVLMAMV